MAAPAVAPTFSLADLPADTGVYFGTEAHEALNHLVRFADVPAFLALLGAVVAFMLWRAVPAPRRSPAWAWLPGVMVCVFGAALTLDAAGGTLLFGSLPNLWWDTTLGVWLIGGIVVVARHALAAWDRPSLTASIALAFAALAAIAWRIDHPVSGGWILCAAAPLAALAAATAPGATPASRLALAIWSLVPLLSSVGPLAYRTWLLQRSHPHSLFTLLCAVTLAAVAWLAIAALVHDTLRSAGPVRREALRLAGRRPAFLAVVVLAVGLTFGCVSGESIQERRNSLKFATIREQALRLDTAALARALAPAFRLDQVHLEPRGSRRPVPLATPSPLPPALAASVQRILDDAFNRSSATDVRLVTLRQGWVVAVASSATRWRQGGGSAPVGPVLLERATARDLDEWARRTPLSRWRSFDRATYQTNRLPVLTRKGRMLGWLETTDTVSSHHAGPSQQRFTPFIATLAVIVLVIFLATDRAQAEERERALRAAAAAEEASQAKGKFLQQINRELRAPLAALAAHGERLHAAAGSAPAHRHLAAIRQQNDLMLRLVDDLLDLGAIESGAFSWSPAPTDAAAVLRDTLEPLHARAAAKGLVLACDVGTDLPALVALDAARFRQIAANLAGNAVKFTDRGGVRVTLRHLTPPGAPALLELAVTDTGPGIAPADQARLFEPFSRLAPTAGKTGTGLGLALSAALCRRAGGTLTVASDGHSGACFRATFPLPAA